MSDGSFVHAHTQAQRKN